METHWRWLEVQSSVEMFLSRMFRNSRQCCWLLSVAGLVAGPGLQLLNNNLRSLWFVNTEISSSRRLGGPGLNAGLAERVAIKNQGFDSIQTVLKSLPTQNQSDT